MIRRMNMKMTDIASVIPWESLSEGQMIKASPLPESNIWWVRLNDGRYGLRINFNGIVHMDISQIRFNGADANLLEKDGQSVSIYDDKQKYADALFIRMKQWMKFLQKLKKKEIDVRVQIGLMAELKFLEYMHSEYLCTYEELLAAWQGPERASKDFMFDNFFAEIKACFDDESSIRISNEKQLMQESKKLFLICYKFVQDAMADNLSEIINCLKQQISAEKENLVSVFEQKLLSAGYNPAVLYENLISVKDVSVMYYKVTDNFPSITVADIPECISNVKYDLDFTGISKYAIQKLFERNE